MNCNKPLKMLASLTFMTALTSCQHLSIFPTDGSATDYVKLEAVCNSFQPIRISRKDVLTEGTAVQIADHNTIAEQWCGPVGEASALGGH